MANRIARLLALAVLFVLAIVGVTARGLVNSGTEPLLSEEGADYAQIARTLAFTGHYRTNAIKPMTVAMGYPIGGCPELTRAPAFPVIVAALFKVGSYSDKWVVGASVLGQVVCITVLFVLGSRLYGGWTGVTAAALGLLNPGMIAYANSGTASTWAAAWVACVLLALSLLQPPPRRTGVPTDRMVRNDRILSVIGPPLAGIACALAYLTEYALLLLIVPVLIYIWMVTPREGRVLAVLSAALPFALVMLPWVGRNLLVARSPFFTLDRYAAMLMTDAYPGSVIYRRVAPPGNPYVFLITHPQAMLANLLRWTDGMARQFPNTVGVLATVGAALLYMTPLKSDSDRIWRWLLVLCTLAVTVSTAVEMPFTAANYLPLLPLVALLGGIALLRLIRRLHGWRKGLTFATLALLMLVPAWRSGGTLLTARTPLRDTATMFRLLAAQGQGPALVITDVPKLAAWYFGVPAVDLPAGGPDLQAVLSANNVGTPVVYLSRTLANPARWTRAERIESYLQLLRTPTPPEGMEEVKLPVPGDRMFMLARGGAARGAAGSPPSRPATGP